MPIPVEHIRHHALVAERDTKWAAVVVVFAIATLFPIGIAALIVSLADGVLRLVLLIVPLAGLVVVLPFWPPLLRGDDKRINEMLQRRRNPS